MRPSSDMRRRVAARAGDCCEYCLIHQDCAASVHQADHVLSEKHGGETVLENLALCCTTCNLRKGSDIGSCDPATGRLTWIFNPRTQRWTGHFRLDGEHLIGLIPIRFQDELNVPAFY